MSCLAHFAGLLVYLPEYQNSRLQRMFHIAARILTLTGPSNHITPLLIELHWLPVSQRIDYTILLITFKAIQEFALLYICDVLNPYSVPRTLRSSASNFLAIRPNRTRCMVIAHSPLLHQQCGINAIHSLLLNVS
jgi:hypothetical protein